MSESATRPQTSGRPAHTEGPPIQRQFVNFACYKMDPSFRRLSSTVKDEARQEFLRVVNEKIPGLLVLSYSTIGLRPETDFILWRIGQSTDEFQAQTAAIN